MIEVAGCETYVVDSGSGPPVVLLHGWGDTADCWRRVVPQLLPDHRVVAVDIPPLGRSRTPLLRDGNDLIDFYDEFFPELFRRLDLRRAIVIGHSLGGAIALHLALEDSDAVERILLVAPAGLGDTAPWWWHVIGGTYLRWTALLRVPSPASRPLVRAGVRAFLRRRLFHDPRRLQDEVEHLVDLHGGRRELSALLAAGRALMRGYTGTLLERAKRELDCPVTMVWGSSDGLVTPEHAYGFARAVPHARVHVLEHCGHYPQIELSSRFNALVSEFLSDPDAHRKRPALRKQRAEAARLTDSRSSPPA
jgi:pimeloyl-ACP methyl ester carboxylesterase